jgi:hypothetical protein
MRKAALVSEQVIRVDAAELDRVRVVCAKCNGAAELPLDRIHLALAKRGHCQFCESPIVGMADAGSYKDPLMQLHQALRALAQIHELARVEFVIKPPAAVLPNSQS